MSSRLKNRTRAGAAAAAAAAAAAPAGTPTRSQTAASSSRVGGVGGRASPVESAGAGSLPWSGTRPQSGPSSVSTSPGPHGGMATYTGAMVVGGKIFSARGVQETGGERLAGKRSAADISKAVESQPPSQPSKR